MKDAHFSASNFFGSIFALMLTRSNVVSSIVVARHRVANPERPLHAAVHGAVVGVIQPVLDRRRRGAATRTGRGRLRGPPRPWRPAACHMSITGRCVSRWTTKRAEKLAGPLHVEDVGLAFGRLALPGVREGERIAGKRAANARASAARSPDARHQSLRSGCSRRGRLRTGNDQLVAAEAGDRLVACPAPETRPCGRTCPAARRRSRTRWERGCRRGVGASGRSR